LNWVFGENQKWDGEAILFLAEQDNFGTVILGNYKVALNHGFMGLTTLLEL
jgi:hypothetical protein